MHIGDSYTPHFGIFVLSVVTSCLIQRIAPRHYLFAEKLAQSRVIRSMSSFCSRFSTLAPSFQGTENILAQHCRYRPGKRYTVYTVSSATGTKIFKVKVITKLTCGMRQSAQQEVRGHVVVRLSTSNLLSTSMRHTNTRDLTCCTFTSFFCFEYRWASGREDLYCTDWIREPM